MRYIKNIFLLLLCTCLLGGCTPPSEEVASPPPETVAPWDSTVEESEPVTNGYIENEYVENNYIEDGFFDENAIQEELRHVAQACKDIYAEMESITQFDGVLFIPTAAEKEQIMSRIAGLGFPVYLSGHDMPNHEKVEEFCEAAQNGLEGSVGIYVFYGNLTRVSLYSKDGSVYDTRVTLSWDEDLQPVFSTITYVSCLEVFEVTDKGWLFFGGDEDPRGPFNYKEGFRITPLGDEKRMLCEKYLTPLRDYTGHNILLSDWDTTCLSSVNFNDVFEMLFEYENGYLPGELYTTRYSPDKYVFIAIPATDFEKVIMKYFPVTAEQLREYAVYDPARQVYAWEPLINGGVSPEWEIVDFTYNNDGSITLTIHAVSEPWGNDKSGVNIVKVMPHDDGTFHYLSNRLEYSDRSAGPPERFPYYWPRVEKEE